jgi:hypothetical protein
MQDILEIFPQESLVLVKKLFAAPIPAKQELLAEVDSYNTEIDEAASTRPDLDVNLAECISRGCAALIEELWDDASEQQRKLIQVACGYFIIEDDEAGDLNSVFGFDDDAAVFNVIAEYLDRDDLLIQV